MESLSNPYICSAWSKQNQRGCRNHCVSGRKVCYIHGGKTPIHNVGPKTKEGKFRQKMASWKHGLRSKERIQERREIQHLIKKAKELIHMKDLSILSQTSHLT